MKTYKQFITEARELDESKSKLAKMAFKGITKLAKKFTKSMRAGPPVKHLKTPFKDSVRMYHGTSTKSANKIMNKGFTPTQTINPKDFSTELSNVYVTDNPKRAEYYSKLISKVKKDKPSIIAVDVKKSDLRKGVRGDEFVVPVSNTRPVATGVQPITRKKGQVIQDNYQHK